MRDLILSFRAAVGDSDYREKTWDSTRTVFAVPGIQPPSADKDQKRRARFTDLAKAWSSETAYMSSLTDIISHPAYREIVAMGPPAIPLLLDQLERERDFWFEALREITQQNPVSEEDAGDLDKMTQAWLEWGAHHGYR